MSSGGCIIYKHCYCNRRLYLEFDWRTTSFEGARREQLHRWAQLPLEHILMAIEEMQDIAQALGTAPAMDSRKKDN